MRRPARLVYLSLSFIILSLVFGKIVLASHLGSFSHSISFGSLLSSLSPTPTVDYYLPQPTPTSTPAQGEVLGAQQIREYIDDLTDESRNRLEDFLHKSYTFDPTGNRQIIHSPYTARDLPAPTLADIAPTPYIPLPTLIASIDKLQQGPTLSPIEYIGQPRKSFYTIVLLGDSMTDTLGRDLPHLKNLLQNEYPSVNFALLNYGFGATDMTSGLSRLTNSTTYLGVYYPPIISYYPDIIVVESFAYNHWGGEKSDLDHQWLTIAKIIDTIKEKSPDSKIILASSIAPDYRTFGDGVLNWRDDLKWDAALVTKAYLQNMINFATSEKYPLVDAFHPSLDSEGNGKGQYINQGDHIHPSDEGKLLYSQKILEAIRNNKLLE